MFDDNQNINSHKFLEIRINFRQRNLSKDLLCSIKTKSKIAKFRKYSPEKLIFTVLCVCVKIEKDITDLLWVAFKLLNYVR